MLICNCSLAGTKACLVCTAHLNELSQNQYTTENRSWTIGDFISPLTKEELDKTKQAMRTCIVSTPTKNLTFEEAFKAIKAGKKVSREDWNGKDQCVFMMPGYPDGIGANEAHSKATGIPVGEKVTILPYLMLKNAQGEFVHWVPSSGDLFSDKWKVVD
jgi:hypothetical protein